MYESVFVFIFRRHRLYNYILIYKYGYARVCCIAYHIIHNLLHYNNNVYIYTMHEMSNYKS